jgi:N-acetylmuramoyl-L-alanine amidase
MLIPRGKYGRRLPVALAPRFITIHSTENPTGNAYDHAAALLRGALRGGRRTGYLFWHFTVQDNLVIQHLPTDEAGEHADMDGPGNRTSIGIEMAENRGNDLARTIDRTARLTAVLMRQYKIPLSNVVPHYHWPREGYDPAHKNCPHFLLDGGKPRHTWQWFKSRVQKYYARIELAETMAKSAAPSLEGVLARHDDADPAEDPLEPVTM